MTKPNETMFWAALSALGVIVLLFVTTAHCQGPTNKIDVSGVGDAARQIKGVMDMSHGGCGSAICPQMANVTMFSPTTADSGLLQFEFPRKMSFVRLQCNTDQGTASVNFDLRTESSPNAAGTGILASAAVCDADGLAVPVTSFQTAIANPHIPIAVIITATSGSPTVVRIHLEYAPTN